MRGYDDYKTAENNLTLREEIEFEERAESNAEKVLNEIEESEFTPYLQDIRSVWLEASMTQLNLLRNAVMNRILKERGL